jgi:hypothetical protein
MTPCNWSFRFMCCVRRSDAGLGDCSSGCDRTQALKLAGAVMPTKQPHTHGANDRLLCPECGGEMTLIRRTPDPEHERQTFECSICLNTIERSADRQAEPHRR